MSRVVLSKPPQPTPDAKGAGVPERKIGSEALAASAKLRKSGIECLSAASFAAARSEQLRLPAEGPLKRRDGSSCKGTLNPLPGLGFSTHGTTLFTEELLLRDLLRRAWPHRKPREACPFGCAHDEAHRESQWASDCHLSSTQRNLRDSVEWWEGSKSLSR